MRGHRRVQGDGRGAIYAECRDAAHTELQGTIENLKKWFYLSGPEKGPAFSFEELVRIGLRCVTRIHDGFFPSLGVEFRDAELSFEDVSLFSDMFFIIFDNVRVHSQMTRPNVQVNAHIEGNDLYISVASDVGEWCINPTSRANIASIKSKIREGAYHRAVRSEGGTGLIKLWNRLRWNPTSGESLDFYFDEEAKRFVVNFALPMIYAEVKIGEEIK